MIIVNKINLTSLVFRKGRVDSLAPNLLTPWQGSKDQDLLRKRKADFNEHFVTTKCKKTLKVYILDTCNNHNKKLAK